MPQSDAPDNMTPWQQVMLALHLLSIDPAGLGGLVLRARSGPVRKMFEDVLHTIPLAPARLHPNISDAQLFGGLDVSGTLAAGKTVFTKGLADEPHAFTLTMAERCPPRLAARLAQMMDGKGGHCLLLLDEGVDDDETAPRCLAERVAFHLDLEGLHYLGAGASVMDMSYARKVFATISASSHAIEQLTAVAAQLGISSLRAPQFALRAARAHAAMHGRDAISDDDIIAAASLVYPSRATVLPDDTQDTEQDDSPPPPPPDEHDDSEASAPESLDQLPQDMLIDAVRALLPEGLLNAAMASGANARAGGATGAGQRKKTLARGRPMPSRQGKLHGGARLDLLATMRAAAPWQAIRANQTGPKDGLHIRPSDLHIRRFEDRSDRLLIFAVDASGSAAMARLAEAKGAIELLLADAYASRDHVALISFRGSQADILLPPTRSLVQTKRRLSALPGGGGTPLASGLQAAFTLAQSVRAKGMLPTVILLTDGRGNIALDGTPGRAQAAEDADKMARIFRVAGLSSIVVDTATRPRGDLAQLAATAGARYVPLPRADASRIQSAVSAAL